MTDSKECLSYLGIRVKANSPLDTQQEEQDIDERKMMKEENQ